MCALDFHHWKERGTPISRMTGKGFTGFSKEISKCIVLCASCHRKTHAGLMEFSQKDLCFMEPILIRAFVKTYLNEGET